MIHGVQISAVTRRIIVIVSDSLSLYHDQMPDRNNLREKKKDLLWLTVSEVQSHLFGLVE
jgi:hypothetical protein